MSTISREEVARLAVLARVDLSDSELNRLAGELDAIVQAVAMVSAVATDDVPATSHPLPLRNVMRPDVVTDPLPVEDAIAAAPHAEGDRFAVPQILGEDA
jgi:aspartyl-tRNA(Asn)/glutamyl-tRNA(Gln) amidotransferase subunit C